MKLDKKTMLKLMKEEYNKRINHYLEEIETKDSKRNVDVISGAVGLKVKNAEGLECTIDGVEKDGSGKEVIVLRKPEDARAGSLPHDILSRGEDSSDYDSHMSSVNEQEEESEEAETEEETFTGGEELRSRSKKSAFKRNIKNYNPSGDSLSGARIENDKIYVPIDKFEKEWSL